MHFWEVGTNRKGRGPPVRPRPAANLNKCICIPLLRRSTPLFVLFLRTALLVTSTDFLLLALVRSNGTYIGHDFGCIACNLIPIIVGDRNRIKERCDQSNRCGTIPQKITGIVQINTRRWIDTQKGQSRTDRFDPTGSTRDTWKQFLERCTMTVCIDQFGGSLTPGYTHHIPCGTPFNDIRDHNRCNDEFTSSIECGFGIVNGQDRTTPNHDFAIVFLTKIRQMIQTIRCRQSEFTNFKSTVNCRLHGFRASFRCSRPQHGTGTNLCKCVQNTFVILE